MSAVVWKKGENLVVIVYYLLITVLWPAYSTGLLDGLAWWSLRNRPWLDPGSFHNIMMRALHLRCPLRPSNGTLAGMSSPTSRRRFSTHLVFQRILQVRYTALYSTLWYEKKTAFRMKTRSNLIAFEASFVTCNMYSLV